MLFHTWTFLLFLLVVLPVYLILRRTGGWVGWLLLASYVFYGWWNPYYLVLILYSTALDYAVVWLMDQCPPASQPGWPGWKRKGGLRTTAMICGASALLCVAGSAVAPASLRPALWALFLVWALMCYGAARASRRTWLVVSVCNNLFLLLFFKYADFVVENVNALLRWTGATLPGPAELMPFGFEYLLPVGISFYTFQSLSYTIDFYRGQIPRERSFLRFATFVAFFPQLVAGPIERSSHLLPQFRRPPSISAEDVTSGLWLFLVGLFKKLALADYLSLYVERVYENPRLWGAPALLLGTFAFAWQIYFDFSGYTDMARGVGRFLGFRLSENFRRPYLANGLGDFWGRWHISLSTWFRDYVYIPLGGNRGRTILTYRNLLLTLLLSALWHGAAWTFVIWGVMHALGLIVTRRLERSAWYSTRLPAFIKQLATFSFVCLAWIFFRAESLQDAGLILHRLAVGTWTDPQMPALMGGLVCLVWFYQWLSESRWQPLLQAAPLRVALGCGMVLFLCLFSTKGGAFIYFQF